MRVPLVPVIDLPIVRPRIVIDRLRREDAQALAASRSDAENARYQGWRSPLGLRDAIELIDENGPLVAFAPGVGVQLAIRPEREGPLIGDFYADRHARDPADLTVGLTLCPGAHGRGHAADAVEAVASAVAAAPGCGIARIVAIVDAENLASLRLWPRCGFLESQRLHRTSVRRDGSVADEVVFVLGL